MTVECVDVYVNLAKNKSDLDRSAMWMRGEHIEIFIFLICAVYHTEESETSQAPGGVGCLRSLDERAAEAKVVVQLFRCAVCQI